MYFRILKKDLKRKKTMNTILLLFVMIAAMFASSSVNNIITVMGGLDNYFEKADMSDQFIINFEKNGEDNISPLLEKIDSVTNFRREQQIAGDSKQLTRNGKKIADFSNSMMILSIDNAKLNYFNKDNDIITEVEEGKAYFTGIIVSKLDIAIGDKFQFRSGDTVIELEYAGIAKDAFLGSDMMGNPRMIINNSDYEKLASDKSTHENNMISVYYINTNDIKALQSDLADLPPVNFNQGKKLLKTTYIMNTLVAGLLLILGVCLILVSFVMLRFTISFTINEEFREIGVMKALGLKNRSVRLLYLVKYLGISVIGSALGFLLSIPFENMLLKSVSDNMVLDNDSSLMIGLICSVAVVGIILLFCWSCTRRIKKLSPIDAVRSGQTGERFRKKSIFSLGKSRLGTTGFLAFNDVFSGPKQFGVMTAIFTVCLLLIMGLANTANTLASEKLLPLMCSTKSDAYITDTEMISKIVTGEVTYQEMCSDIKKKLADNGMDATLHSETLITPNISFKDEKCTTTFMFCRDTKASDYTYCEGYAPKYGNEIAVTYLLADKLGAGIGDKIEITIGDKTDEYIISGFFQSMVTLGETGRFHEDADIPDEMITQVMGFQIDFNDHPDKATVDERIEKMKDIFSTKYVDDANGYVMECIGADIKDTLVSVKLLVIAVTVIMTIMIAVLMERSFISKEKSEIALMKAMGFRTSSVIAQHTLRFLIVSAASAVIAMLLCKPVTKLCIDPIFGIMGAMKGIEYNIRPVEVFAVYPLIITAAAVIGAMFTALYTKTIKASDTSDIE
ncbi:MAG: FtsX-like permease family protein [Ruminococcus sp.]|nr:FtsX-like permease family protein [Ruminococcus sp.]